jgi:maleylacetoacetate isomerase
MQDSITLYSYFRSSASHRVRIALHYKNIPFTYKAVHLLKDGGQQHQADFKKLNPQAQVPYLIHNGKGLGQSLAIIQYLDAIFPNKKLFTEDPYQRAKILQFCEVINSGIQPLQNLMVLKKLESQFNASIEQKNSWVTDWNHHYLASLEKYLNETAQDFCFGKTVTAADCFLAAHVQSTKRYNISLNSYPTIQRICENINRLDAFIKAAPENQPDFEK